MAEFVVREPTVADLKEEEVGLRNAVGGVFSELLATRQSAASRVRHWFVGLLFFVGLGVIALWFQNPVGTVFIYGGGAVALLGMFEAYSTKWVLQQILDQGERQLRYYGFDCQWSEPDLDGKRWAKVESMYLPVNKVPN